MTERIAPLATGRGPEPSEFPVPTSELARPRLIAVLVLTASFVLASASPAALFFTNDSPAMKAIVSGEFGGTPTSELVFSSRLLAIPLAWLFELLPTIPWYTLLLTLPILTLLALVILIAGTREEVVGWALLGFPTITHTALRPDYTWTAIVGTTLATILIIRSASVPRARRRGLLLLASLLLMLSASWRLEAGLLAILTSAPLLLTYALVGKRMKYVGIVLGLWPAAFLLSHYLSRQSTSNWREYLTFNIARGELHGTLRTQLIDSYSSGIPKWTPTSTEAFANFIYPDSWYFGNEILQLLNTAVPSVAALPKGGLQEVMYPILPALMVAWPLILASLLCLAYPTVLDRGNARLWGLAAAGSTIYWVLLYALVSLVRLPLQVALPASIAMAFLLAALALELPTGNVAFHPKAVSRRVAVGLAVAVIILFGTLHDQGVVAQVRQGLSLRADTGNLARTVKTVKSCDSYVADAGVSGAAMSSPYGSSPLFELPVLPLGWSTFSPAFDERKVLLGLESDVMTELRLRGPESQRPSTCLLGSDYTAEVYRRLMLQFDYGNFIPVRIAQLPEPWGYSSIWKFVEATQVGSQ